MKWFETLFGDLPIWKYEKWVIFFGLLIFWVVLFSVANLFQSGLHFTDDHEIILFNDLLKTKSIFALSYEQVTIDLATRFRPLYYPHRVLMTYFLGTNASLWAIYFCLLGVLSSYFLAQALRKYRFSIVLAILFPLFAFWGEQTAVWWRLGTAETLGMLFCALSMYYLLQLPILGLLFVILASLSKESFILMLPALLFWKIWYELTTPAQLIRNGEIVNAHSQIKVIIRANIFYIIVLAVVAFVELYFIQTQTKAEESIFNATRESDVAFRNTILTYMIVKVLTFNKLNILTLAFFAVLLFALSDDLKNAKNKLMAIVRAMLPALFFSLLVLIPQFLLYSRTDLYERYLIPATVGLAFFAIFLIQLIVKQNFIKKYLKIAFCILGIAGLYFPIGKAYFKAHDFAEEGIQTTAFLKFINTVTPEQSSILLVAEPVQYNEWIQAFYRYLNSSLYNRQSIVLQLYTIPNPNVPTEFAQAHKEKISHFFKKQLFDFEKDKDKIGCIAFFPSQETEAKFLNEKKNWIQERGFKRTNFGGFVIYSP